MHFRFLVILPGKTKEFNPYRKRLIDKGLMYVVAGYIHLDSASLRALRRYAQQNKSPHVFNFFVISYDGLLFCCMLSPDTDISTPLRFVSMSVVAKYYDK